LYRALVSLYLPNGTALAGADGATTQAPGLTTEDGRTVVGYRIDVPPGASSIVTLHLTLAPRRRGQPYSLALVPIPRVRPTSVSVDVTADGNEIRRALTPLDRPTTVGVP
jgi:hypothetical protein